MNVTVSAGISQFDEQEARKKFKQLMLYLGIRTNNYHVANGQGGNNWLLCLLAEYDHMLVSDSIRPRRTDGKMTWGVGWLKETPLGKMREELDAIMDSQPRHIVMSMFLNHNGRLHDAFPHHKALMPDVDCWLQGFPLTRELSWQEQLLAACLLCEDTAEAIDKNKVVDSTKLAKLITLPEEILLLSIRWKIQIDRLIRANLDEDPILGPVLSKIKKAVND